ncbi:hypothetical protein DL93DRAFT_2081887 [Clavulina sp. PMI_390]|nr:hypothetical protein DL93DRAFT_2081887 [Clavulina sp. PMI_390]
MGVMMVSWALILLTQVKRHPVTQPGATEEIDRKGSTEERGSVDEKDKSSMIATV